MRSLKRINDDALMADLTCINIDSECRDVNTIVNHYDNTLSTTLDKHAPFKVRSVPEKLFSLIIEIGRQKYVQSCIFTR